VDNMVNARRGGQLPTVAVIMTSTPVLAGLRLTLIVVALVSLLHCVYSNSFTEPNVRTITNSIWGRALMSARLAGAQHVSFLRSRMYIRTLIIIIVKAPKDRPG
jgi:hypothetical protein